MKCKKNLILGVLLAIFEEFGIIQAFQGKTNLSVGTVAAGNDVKFRILFARFLFILKRLAKFFYMH